MLLRRIRSRDYASHRRGDEFALIVSADMDEEQRSRDGRAHPDSCLCAHRYRIVSAFVGVTRLRLLSGGWRRCRCVPQVTAVCGREKQHYHRRFNFTEEQS